MREDFSMNESKARYIFVELAHHLPFTIFGVTSGLILTGLLNFFVIITKSQDIFPQACEQLFHIFHPCHIIFSAVATTAMFWKHEHKLIQAIIVGLIGSLAICALSDYYFPMLGGFLLGVPMEVHVCIIEEPGLIFPFAILGVLGGLLVTQTFEHSTQYSHTAHVFVSSVASILYLIAFGFQEWIPMLGGVLVITVISVMIPCCTSDIIFPLFCTHKHR